MKASEIIALATAGYTAEQIATIAAAAKNEPTQQAPAQPAQQAQQAPAQQAPAQPAQPAQQAPAQQAPAQQDPNAALMAKLEALTTQLQQGAIFGSTQPKQVTADDILADIIDPPKFHPNKSE